MSQTLATFEGGMFKGGMYDHIYVKIGMYDRIYVKIGMYDRIYV